ncbi:hypothetical protein NBRC10512_004811 [Rhodotorula toruloides]|uniref:RHTO0S03e04082g1_1 n=2 Tax=Rhodotorula toruloides TaxID=5286 RepID=A0A061AKM6_RHOTO|nr:gram domain protein [Rhodotorula toruloides NP11]EMS25787.1 gram domain protein [Rhodotorula toruloides NP11]CDR38125.1 RHTO0S03e04082g1_1 [Rhodotorula toruloides]
MLSRLKRRAPSTSLADPPLDDPPSPPAASDTASHNDTTLSSPSPAGKSTQRSFTTPVKGQADRDSGRTLSPARAYGTGAVGAGRASRSSSFGSFQGERRTINLSSPGELGNSGGRVDDIGHGSLTLDHLALPDGSSAPLTLVVQAPELLTHVEQQVSDGDAPTPTGDGPDQRTPLAAPTTLFPPAATGATSSSGSGLGPVVPHNRPRSHTTSEAPPPGCSTRANGLDALAKINNSTLSPHSESPTKQLRTSSPPSSSRPQSRAASRPLSRSSSINSQQQPDNLSLRPPGSVSPARGRKGTMSKNGIAGALALSGVALASPSQSLRHPNVLAPLAAVGNGASAPVSPGTASSSTEERPANPADAPASARDSLDNHTSPAASVIDHGHSSPGEALVGVPLATTYSRDQPSMYDGALGVGSTLGDHLSGFLSMDQLGDFDDVVSMLGTGYAVASSKRNADFHALFKHIPEDDYLIEDYGCALQREILIQGRLYISEHHLSFYANIFGWVTSLTIPFSEVCSIEKRMTAYVIPNAIQIATMHARHTFASFLSRDTTYDLIGNIWRMFHPVVPMSAALPDTLSTSGNSHAAGESEDEEAAATQDAQSSPAVEGKKERAKKRLKGFRRPRGGTGESTGSTNKSVDFALPVDEGSAESKGEGEAGEGKKKGKKGAVPAHPPTVDTCPTLKNLKEVCMDTTFPGAPEKIYNLMFTSGFMKDFWAENQKLTEIQIGDWAPQASGSNLLARSMSYIKPLNGSIGPKSTKCLITDESAHVDFDDYVCVVTTTRTPDVPSGSAFAVKTRTSMTWAKNNHCRVVVTTGVEWSKSSFIKGIIEKSAIDGQKQYHTDLEKAMRAYIHSHRNEFVEEGQDPDAASSASEDEGGSIDGSVAGLDMVSQAQAEDAAAKAAPNGVLGTVWCTLEPAVETLANQSAASLALGAVVVVLVLSNLWTLRSAGGARDGDLHPAERVRRRNAAGFAGGTEQTVAGAGAGGGGDRTPQEVAMAVRDVLQDYFAVQHGIGLPATARERQAATTQAENAGKGKGKEEMEEEVRDIELVLDRLEERIGRLRSELREAAASGTGAQAQKETTEALGDLD